MESILRSEQKIFSQFLNLHHPIAKKNEEQTLVKRSSLSKQLDITEFQSCPHMRFQLKLIMKAQNNTKWN